MSECNLRFQSPLRGAIVNDPALFEPIAQVASAEENEHRRWVRELRDLDVRAAHPDDGHVDRTNNSIVFCYPQFDLDPKVGNLIVLGSPPHMGARCERFARVVRIEHERYIFGGTYARYYFEEVPRPGG